MTDKDDMEDENVNTINVTKPLNSGFIYNQKALRRSNRNVCKNKTNR